MESIQEPNIAFPFNNLILTPPTNSSGGNHFMRFSLNDNPFYIQTPKCKTKQTVVKTTGKRTFLDLTFTNENEEFIQWVENLEAHCQKFIYLKRERWFDSALEESDIENLFTSILKPIKMGKFYLLRANIPIAVSTLKIYDENENLMNLEELKEDTNIICILEFQGIKCSARGFQVDIEIKQILVLKPTNIFDKCILSKKNENNSISNTVLESGTIVPQIKTVLESNNSEHIKINTDNLDSINNIDNVEEQLDIQLNNENVLNFSDFEITNKDEGETQSLTNLLNSIEYSSDSNVKKQTDNDADYSNDEDCKEEKYEKLEKEKKEENFKNKLDLLEIDLNLEEVPPEDSIILKQRNDVYYEMYKEALKKAKMAKDLALSSYLEAKRIKNLYMLDDLSDDSELEDFIGEVDNNENLSDD